LLPIVSKNGKEYEAQRQLFVTVIYFALHTET